MKCIRSPDLVVGKTYVAALENGQRDVTVRRRARKLYTSTCDGYFFWVVEVSVQGERDDRNIAVERIAGWEDVVAYRTCYVCNKNITRDAAKQVRLGTKIEFRCAVECSA